MKQRSAGTKKGWALASALAVLTVAAAACESDPTGVSGRCEVIYQTSATPGPSGIEVHNATGGGLSVLVDSNLYAGAEANMGAGACEVWAYPAGTYPVTLQRCEQANPGETTCTTMIGPVRHRSVTVQDGARTVLTIRAQDFS